MSSENVTLLEVENEIKNNFINELNRHNHLLTSPNFVNYYMDLTSCYKNGLKTCEHFCKEQNILELVRELLINGFFNEVVKLKQYIGDNKEKAKLILEAEFLEKFEELLATVEEIKKKIFG